jgi:hypothetical protein
MRHFTKTAAVVKVAMSRQGAAMPRYGDLVAGLDILGGYGRKLGMERATYQEKGISSCDLTMASARPAQPKRSIVKPKRARKSTHNVPSWSCLAQYLTVAWNCGPPVVELRATIPVEADFLTLWRPADCRVRVSTQGIVAVDRG